MLAQGETISLVAVRRLDELFESDVQITFSNVLMSGCSINRPRD